MPAKSKKELDEYVKAFKKKKDWVKISAQLNAISGILFDLGLTDKEQEKVMLELTKAAIK